MISRMTKPQKEKLQKKLYTTVDDKKKRYDLQAASSNSDFSETVVLQRMVSTKRHLLKCVIQHNTQSVDLVL